MQAPVQVYPTAPAGTQLPENGVTPPGQRTFAEGGEHVESPGKPKSPLSKMKHKARKLKDKIKSVTGSNTTTTHDQVYLENEHKVDQEDRAFPPHQPEYEQDDVDDSYEDCEDEDGHILLGDDQLKYKQMQSIGAMDKPGDGSEGEVHGGVPASALAATPDTYDNNAFTSPFKSDGLPDSAPISPYKNAGPPGTLQAAPTEYHYAPADDDQMLKGLRHDASPEQPKPSHVEDVAYTADSNALNDVPSTAATSEQVKPKPTPSGDVSYTTYDNAPTKLNPSLDLPYNTSHVEAPKDTSLVEASSLAGIPPSSDVKRSAGSSYPLSSDMFSQPEPASSESPRFDMNVAYPDDIVKPNPEFGQSSSPMPNKIAVINEDLPAEVKLDAGLAPEDYGSQQISPLGKSVPENIPLTVEADESGDKPASAVAGPPLTLPADEEKSSTDIGWRFDNSEQGRQEPFTGESGTGSFGRDEPLVSAMRDDKEGRTDSDLAVNENESKSLKTDNSVDRRPISDVFEGPLADEMSAPAAVVTRDLGLDDGEQDSTRWSRGAGSFGTDESEKPLVTAIEDETSDHRGMRDDKEGRTNSELAVNENESKSLKTDNSVDRRPISDDFEGPLADEMSTPAAVVTRDLGLDDGKQDSGRRSRGAGSFGTDESEKPLVTAIENETSDHRGMREGRTDSDLAVNENESKSLKTDNSVDRRPISDDFEGPLADEMSTPAAVVTRDLGLDDGKQDSGRRSRGAGSFGTDESEKPLVTAIEDETSDHRGMRGDKEGRTDSELALNENESKSLKTDNSVDRRPISDVFEGPLADEMSTPAAVVTRNLGLDDGEQDSGRRSRGAGSFGTDESEKPLVTAIEDETSDHRKDDEIEGHVGVSNDDDSQQPLFSQRQSDSDAREKLPVSDNMSDDNSPFGQNVQQASSDQENWGKWSADKLNKAKDAVTTSLMGSDKRAADEAPSVATTTLGKDNSEVPLVTTVRNKSSNGGDVEDNGMESNVVTGAAPAVGAIAGVGADKGNMPHDLEDVNTPSDALVPTNATEDVEYYDPNNSNDNQFQEGFALGTVEAEDEALNGTLAGSTIGKLQGLTDVVATKLGLTSSSHPDSPNAESVQNAIAGDRTEDVSSLQVGSEKPERTGVVQGLKNTVASTLSYVGATSPKPFNEHGIQAQPAIPAEDEQVGITNNQQQSGGALQGLKNVLASKLGYGVDEKPPNEQTMYDESGEHANAVKAGHPSNDDVDSIPSWQETGGTLQGLRNVVASKLGYGGPMQKPAAEVGNMEGTRDRSSDEGLAVSSVVEQDLAGGNHPSNDNADNIPSWQETGGTLQGLTNVAASKLGYGGPMQKPAAEVGNMEGTRDKSSDEGPAVSSVVEQDLAGGNPASSYTQKLFDTAAAAKDYMSSKAGNGKQDSRVEEGKNTSFAENEKATSDM